MEILESFVANQPLWLVAIILLTGLAMFEFFGRALRRLLQRRAKQASDRGEGIDYLLSSVFALLGLLIAFTFGMALDRYESRRDLVVQEANAIGTAHIRTAFAAEPLRTQLREQLEAYAANRLAYGRAAFHDKPPLAAEAEKQRSQLAATGIAATQSVTSAPMGPAVMASINDVIDVGSAREAINLAKVPTSVVAMLVGYAFIAAFVLGYSQALPSLVHRIGNGLLFLLLTLSLVTIFDLDRPATGTIKVSQQPLVDLIRGFKN
ncbi:MAG: hypothetical protein CFE32_04270 [Alphaproteobacteria bacterium PA3]|nr:MAG: hypothetical protein CFE32_04270 [Alphaproteobacteria bacterium PA3]